MNIDPRELHRFTPSRPDGTVCIAVRPVIFGAEVCGYPAGHPIHADPPNGDTPEDRGPQQDLRVLRGIVMGHIGRGEESYPVAMKAIDRLFDLIRSTPDPPPRCHFKSAHSCRICNRWLEGEWNRAAPWPERAELQRQMNAGHCDLCHERVCAAIAARQLRSWPALEDAPEDVTVVDVDGHGRWDRASVGGSLFRHRGGVYKTRNFGTLRHLGNVREVRQPETPGA